MSSAVQLVVATALTDDERRPLLDLVHRAEHSDGATPLNEAAMLRLNGRLNDDGGLHLIARDGQSGALLGYAQLDPGPAGSETSTGQLVVAPEQRHGGVGTALLNGLLDQATTPLRVWAKGASAGAQALAARVGLTRARMLLIMRRPLDTRPVVPEPSDGVALRTFRPGVDDQTWLAVNAAAFVDHPEQGAMTLTDLHARMAEGWFDPAGFVLAVNADHPDQILGFHWTKRHGVDSDGVALGEVYVLGVAPDQAGRGLGRVLLDAGLAALYDAGCRACLLYVEGDNTRARELYGRSGFVVATRDVMYAP